MHNQEKHNVKESNSRIFYLEISNIVLFSQLILNQFSINSVININKIKINNFVNLSFKYLLKHPNLLQD